MDQIGNMAAFVKVVETGSFVKAAGLLHLSTTMVSKHVRALEERLGTQLLHRTTRKISLTEAGSEVYERCADILLALEDLENSASRSHSVPRGVLRVSAPTVFGTWRIAAMLPDLAERYPEMTIDLTLIDRPVDLIEEGLDVAIVIGDLAPSGHVTRLLTQARTIVCAAPDYLARRGTPLIPADLAGHNCFLHTGWLGADGWRFAAAGAPLREVTVSGNFRVNGFLAQRTAARDGHGLAVLPYFFVEKDLESGRLVRVLADQEGPKVPIRLIYPAGRRLPCKTRVFIDSLLTAVTRDRALFE